MKAFQYEDVQEGQAAFNVYCNIYRNGELIDGGSQCIPEHIILDEDDPALEEKLMSIAGDYIMRNVQYREAEHLLTDIVIEGDVYSHSTLQVSYREPLYEAIMVEEYTDFKAILVHHYDWCKLTDEERAKQIESSRAALENPIIEDLEE